MANKSEPRFVLSLRVSFEELLALNAAVNLSIKGVQGELDRQDDGSDDWSRWVNRLEILRSLSDKLDRYIDNPTFVGEQEGGKSCLKSVMLPVTLTQVAWPLRLLPWSRCLTASCSIGLPTLVARLELIRKMIVSVMSRVLGAS